MRCSKRKVSEVMESIELRSARHERLQSHRT